jgi:uncharacterized protein (TIGR00255 family)
MALSSMTGFARASFEVEGARFSWEAKSVNARGLDIRLRLPSGFDHLEAEIRTRIRETIPRGNCFFTLAREGDSERSRLVVNKEALALVVATARRLAAEEGIAMPTADGLLAIPGVLLDGDLSGSGGEATGRRDAAVIAGLRTSIESLLHARREEGARLEGLLREHVDRIECLVAEAEQVASNAPEILRARIQEQVALLMADAAGLNPDRLHQEALLAATRADVREELDRLRSHITAARELMKSGDGAGRRLEFLTQEFNREANTLCAKAFDARLTRIGLELKAVIDQVREQVQIRA